jgi:hypothetical protein
MPCDQPGRARHARTETARDMGTDNDPKPFEDVSDKVLHPHEAPIGEVDMKLAPGPVRASRTDRRSDRSRP